MSTLFKLTLYAFVNAGLIAVGFLILATETNSLLILLFIVWVALTGFFLRDWQQNLPPG